MIRSIRLTLSLWYMGILAGVLILFSWVLYTSITANLAQDVNELLASQATQVTNSLATFWKASDDAAQSGGETLWKTVNEGRLPGLVSRWVSAGGSAEIGRPLRVLDRDGRVLYTAPSFTQLALPMTKSALGQARRRRLPYEEFGVSNRRVRLLTAPAVENGRVLYLVQVAAVLQQAGVPLERLRRWLMWLIPPTLFVTSVGGWFLATRAMRPVGQMISQVQQIGEGHLHERIDVPRTDDELERLAGTFNDMLKRLEHAFHRLRQFSAAASHELRTPLTVMKGEIEVALRKPRDDEEYRQVLRRHLETLNEMAGIVEELLMLARSEAVEGVVEWRPVALDELVRRVCDTLRPLAEAKKIRVEIRAASPTWVRGERRLLERLVANLFDNAVKYTPRQGRVSLQVERRDDHAYLAVRDTGPGIAREELPKIFDRFFSRRAAENSDRPNGLGLGLCRWIVEAHQGRIDVDTAPGQGATFTIQLPLSVTPA